MNLLFVIFLLGHVCFASGRYVGSPIIAFFLCSLLPGHRTEMQSEIREHIAAAASGRRAFFHGSTGRGTLIFLMSQQPIMAEEVDLTAAAIFDIAFYSCV